MKLAKEVVLIKHCKNERGHWIGISKEGVLKAMDEWAEIQNKELKERIKCLEFIIDNDIKCNETKHYLPGEDE